MIRLLGGLLRYDLPGWYGVGGAEPCGTIGDPALRDNRRPSPAVQGLGAVVLSELSVLIYKVRGRSEVGGWLPVSLTNSVTGTVLLSSRATVL